jgi:hypothetical protein
MLNIECPLTSGPPCIGAVPQYPGDSNICVTSSSQLLYLVRTFLGLNGMKLCCSTYVGSELTKCVTRRNSRSVKLHRTAIVPCTFLIHVGRPILLFFNPTCRWRIAALCVYVISKTFLHCGLAVLLWPLELSVEKAENSYRNDFVIRIVHNLIIKASKLRLLNSRDLFLTLCTFNCFPVDK